MALRVALVLVLLAVLVLGAAWIFQRRLIYFPDTSAVPPAVEVITGAEDLTLVTEDGLELGAWFVPPAADDREVAVLVANGNAGNRADRAGLAQALAGRGFSVLLFDYRGYGGNAGSPSEEGLLTDARAAADALGERGFGPERTIYFGESLGSGVVAALLAERPPAGAVLRSPFTDLAAVGEHHYPWLPVDLLLRDRFDVLGPVRHSEIPITVILGEQDSIVPTSLSREVAHAAPRLVEVVEIPGAGHNDPVMFGPRVADAVVRLAEEAD